MSFVDIAATALAILACIAGALFLFVLTFVVVDEHGPHLDVPWREERSARQPGGRQELKKGALKAPQPYSRTRS